MLSGYLCILKIKSLSIAEKAMMPTLVTVIAAIYLFVSLIVLAPRKLGYSHIKHTISEIGETGARNQRFALKRESEREESSGIILSLIDKKSSLEEERESADLEELETIEASLERFLERFSEVEIRS